MSGYIMKIFRIKQLLGFISLIIFSFFYIFSSVADGQQPKHSRAFHYFLQYVDVIYIQQLGSNIEHFSKTNPNGTASCIGHGLRQQMRYVTQNPAYKPMFTSLQREAKIYLNGVASACNYHAPDGQPTNGSVLWQIAVENMNGKYEDYWTKMLGRNYNAMPICISSREMSSRTNPPTIMGKLQEEESLEMIGVVAPNTGGINGPPAKHFNNPLKKEHICGIWEEINTDQNFKGGPSMRIEIRQQGEVFVGRIHSVLDYKSFLKYYGFPSSGDIFRIKCSSWSAVRPDPRNVRYRAAYYEGEGWETDYKIKRWKWGKRTIALGHNGEYGLNMGDWLIMRYLWPIDVDQFRRVGR